METATPTEEVETSTEKKGVIYTETPNGTKIEFTIKSHEYKVNGKTGFVSVTKALDALDKPALPWWGMTVGVKGLHALIGMGVVRLGYTPDQRPVIVKDVGGIWTEQSPENLVDLLTEIKATVNHVRDTAGDRGQSAHDALEAWGATGVLPEPEEFTFEEQPYVQALRDFLELVDFEVDGNEVAVASLKHMYAGRYDIRGRLKKDVRVVTKVYPVAKPKHILLDAGTWIWDLKTSKDIYESHLLQTEGYEGASIECGHEATDNRGVLQVGADGRYQFRVVKDLIVDDFVQVVETYRMMQRAKGALKV